MIYSIRRSGRGHGKVKRRRPWEILFWHSFLVLVLVLSSGALIVAGRPTRPRRRARERQLSAGVGVSRLALAENPAYYWEAARRRREKAVGWKPAASVFALVSRTRRVVKRQQDLEHEREELIATIKVAIEKQLPRFVREFLEAAALNGEIANLPNTPTISTDQGGTHYADSRRDYGGHHPSEDHVTG